MAAFESPGAGFLAFSAALFPTVIFTPVAAGQLFLAELFAKAFFAAELSTAVAAVKLLAAFFAAILLTLLVAQLVAGVAAVQQSLAHAQTLLGAALGALPSAKMSTLELACALTVARGPAGLCTKLRTLVAAR